MILLIQLQVLARRQGMDLVRVLSIIRHSLRWCLGAEAHDANTSLVERHIVHGGIVEEALDLGFPEIERIMSEDNDFLNEINNNDTVNVDVDSLMGKHKLSTILILENIHINIINIKFILQVDDEKVFLVFLLCFLDDVQLMEFQQIGTQLLVTLVREDVEVLIVPNNVLDIGNAEELVEIVLLVILQVDHLGIFWSGHDTNCLIWIENEEFGLGIEVLEIKQLHSFILHKVELDDLTGVCKDHGFTVIEVKINTLTDLGQFELFHVYSLMNSEFVCLWVPLDNDDLCDDFFTVDHVFTN